MAVRFEQEIMSWSLYAVRPSDKDFTGIQHLPSTVVALGSAIF
jgi:hypothetical protein